MSREDDSVGSVGDEAAKLLGALADWAGGQPGSGGSEGIAGRVADTARQLNDHVATGDAECLYCPICRTVHAIRQTSPEVRTQLAQAASTFLQAAAGLLAAAGTGDQQPSRVQHIDLDDDGADDGAEDGADGEGPG
jgi:hypothetical protein